PGTAPAAARPGPGPRAARGSTGRAPKGSPRPTSSSRCSRSQDLPRPLWLNVGLLAFFAVLLQREGLLGFAKGGRWYLTWFATALITLMDELSSIFFVPAEAHRFIGATSFFLISIPLCILRFPYYTLTVNT